MITTTAMDERPAQRLVPREWHLSQRAEQRKHNAIAALNEAPEERASPQETRDSRKRIRELERDLFVSWYNHDHRHSGIGHVSPAQRHNGEDASILTRRHALYRAARAALPRR